jgi:hypothetical protein
VIRTLRINLEKLAETYGMDSLMTAVVEDAEDGGYSLVITGGSREPRA